MTYQELLKNKKVWVLIIGGAIIGWLLTLLFANRHIASEEKRLEGVIDDFISKNPNKTLAEVKDAIHQEIEQK